MKIDPATEGPRTPFSQQLHAQKYRLEGESFREAMSRVASALAGKREEFDRLRDLLLDMRFMPAGRIQSAMGSPKRVTPYNCFVSGTIEDSFTQGHGCIMDRAREAAATMRMGGGIGYDFSTLRPKGSTIRKLGSRSSGPVSFMGIYDAICRCVASSGHRRGAQMGVLRVDHPDILEFVNAKHDEHSLTGFNMSVAVTDEFMVAMMEGRTFPLRWGGRVHSEVDARALWEAIMRSTWDWAEPGVIFIDTVNRRNNLRYCETIAATNPCGEQPLPPYGACLLGSFNLVRYVRPFTDTQGADDVVHYSFDFDQFRADIPVAVRAMDAVVDLALYPMHEQEREAQNKRRMGLGVTGLANAIEAVGFRYGSDEFVEMEKHILRVLNRTAYLASVELAREKGPFPLFVADRYLEEGTFASTLDEDVRDAIRRHGVRNSHLTSIAPTGTISLCADNVSSGIEPVFADRYTRTIRGPDGDVETEIRDYGLRVFSKLGKIAREVTIQEHLNVLLAAAKNVDSAVSKTCNVPPKTDWDQFKQLYVSAWQGGAKGCTTFQIGGKRFGVLNAQEDGTTSCRVDPKTGEKGCGE